MTQIKDINIAAYDSAVKCLKSDRLAVLSRIDENIKRKIREIRIYADKAVMLCCDDKYLFVRCDGSLSNTSTGDRLIIDSHEMQDIFTALCDYSVYSMSHEISCGYVTLRGGHRVGICGTAVLDKNGIAAIKDISSLSLRVARQIYGCSDKIVDIFKQSTSGLIIAGPPCSGKTTILRDLARQLSSGALGSIIPVAVADERGEIGAVKNGKAQNDIGFACSCFDGYPKHIAIEQAVRCLSPQIILCDEICTVEQVEAISQGFNSGVRFIATVHALNREDIKNRKVITKLLATNAFDKVIILGSGHKVGKIQEICNAYALD